MVPIFGSCPSVTYQLRVVGFRVRVFSLYLRCIVMRNQLEIALPIQQVWSIAADNTFAMVSHPRYHVFADIGFQWLFQMLERNQTTYRIKIWEGYETPADDGVMEVLWTTTSELDA